MPVITGAAAYPDHLIEKMQEKGVQVDALDRLSLAEQAGSSKAVNIVLMGRLSRYFPDIPEDAWQEALTACVPPKYLELKLSCFCIRPRGNVMYLVKKAASVSWQLFCFSKLFCIFLKKVQTFLFQISFAYPPRWYDEITEREVPFKRPLSFTRRSFS